MKLLDTYFFLRHGEAKSNKNNLISSWPETFENPLTKKGEKKARKAALDLKNKKIDLIFSSDVLRCKETAQIVAKELNLDVNFDKRLREIDFGSFNGRLVKEWYKHFNNEMERFSKKPPRAENRRELKKRMMDFIKDTNDAYGGKNILVVSHQDNLLVLMGELLGFSEKELLSRKGKKLKLKTGEFRKL